MLRNIGLFVLAYEAAFIKVESRQWILNLDENKKAEFQTRWVFPTFACLPKLSEKIKSVIV